MIKKLLKTCPEQIDLANNEHLKKIIEIAEVILQQGYNFSKIESIEDELFEKLHPSTSFMLLVLKIVKSKMLTSKISKPLLISVVFAVYKEHNRIKKQSEHPHGENFLLKKVDQLEWLFQDVPDLKWELIIVDDGCPEGSGLIAQDIVHKYGLNNKVRVLHLAQAIYRKYAPVRDLHSTSNSQKGGSIIYGMWDGIRRSKIKNQIVIYTDADLSTHLGQAMLLVEPLLDRANLAAIGSRREPKSILVKPVKRDNRGKLFIYLWKRLIPNLQSIVDTQCGFKAFRADVVSNLIKNLIEKKFAFDLELLIKTELLQKNSIVKVPIAWIDSEKASTTVDLQPYLTMLKSIAKMSENYFPEAKASNTFIDFIANLQEQEFRILLKNIPDAIMRRDPAEFTKYDQIGIDDFKAILTLFLNNKGE